MIDKHEAFFCLDKTYMDFTDEAGNCFIFYSARLKLFFFRTGYSACIFSDANGQVQERSVFKRVKVFREGEKLLFSGKELDLGGEWMKITPAVEAVLYRHKQRSVYWNCHHPLARASVYFGNKTFTGLGYAENLFLSVKPWQLPIDQLRWGRFLAPGTTISWIQWAGKYPLNKLFYNGTEFSDAVFTDSGVCFNNTTCSVDFLESSLIRDVHIGEHLARVPLLKILVKRSLLNLREMKYKAFSRFTDSTGQIQQGWSIFEIVI